MIRTILIGLVSLLSFSPLFGQTREIDSLKRIVSSSATERVEGLAALRTLSVRFAEMNAYDSQYMYAAAGVKFLPDFSASGKVDSNTIVLLADLGAVYQFRNLDSAILLSGKALEWAGRIQFRRGEALASVQLGENLRLKGDYTHALELLLQAIRISREIKDAGIETNSLLFTGTAYSALGANRVGLNYMQEGMAMKKNITFPPMVPFIYSNMGDAYEKLGMLDSALIMQEMAASMVESVRMAERSLKAQILGWLGLVHVRLGNTEKALKYYRESNALNDYLNLGVSQFYLADLFHTLNQADSSLHYARLSYVNSSISSQLYWKQQAARLLVALYSARKEMDSGFYYQRIALQISDSLFSPQKFNALQLAAVNERQIQFDILQKQKEAEQERLRFANKVKVYGLLAGLAVFLLVALILFRSVRQKQADNLKLNKQKDEIGQALTDLKGAQAQLVQSEKMASLGQLTAGIAHEIQNPLNFVNNFSEVNLELADDLVKAIDGKDYDEAQDLATDIRGNQEKIVEHGKRADGIVKSMLQHSRSSSGQKEPTDLAALADEYLKLSYHGMRAKDKGFNVTLETDFEPGLPKIDIVSQDIGRVLLNLYNNAFQAVMERKNSGEEGYEPKVRVEISGVGGQHAALSSQGAGGQAGKQSATVDPESRIQNPESLLLRVTDNGSGVPDAIRDKVFQPFFTTKPTGQGTGLGLSLSYDIVKAHGGTLTLAPAAGEGTKFEVLIPFS